MIQPDVLQYHESLDEPSQQICLRLMDAIELHLPQAEGKVWHGSPVWFIDGNPIVGYSRQKDAVQLLFWSGQSFDEPDLTPTGKHKAAQARFTQATQIDSARLAVWLQKAQEIQWDYQNIAKRNGELLRLF